MRTPVTVKIKFKSASLDQFIERYSVDVSKAGIFIRTPKPLSVGTNLNFEFQLQDGSPLLNGNGTVVWVRDEKEPAASPGMGVRFDTLPDSSQEILQQLLDRKDDAQAFGQQLDEPPLPPPSDDEEEAMAIDLPEPPAAMKETATPEPEPPTEPATEPEPAPAAAKEPVTVKEEYRKENLDRIFDEPDVKEPEKADAPLIEKPRPRKVTPEPARLEPTAKPVEPDEQEKSSGIVWVLILLVLAGAGFLYYKYQYAPKHQKAIQVDQGVAKPQVPTTPPPIPKISMEVKSEPAGAKIIVNGEATGKITPATLENLDPMAEIDLALDIPGKKLHKTRLKPSEQPYSATITEDSQRSIRITSEPIGATIYLNKKKIGTTPTKLEKNIDFKRTHKVRLFLEGYVVAEGQFVGDKLDWKRDGLDEIGTFSMTLVRKAEAEKKAVKAPMKRIRRRPRIRRIRRPRVKPDEPAAETPPATDTPKPETKAPETKAPETKAPETKAPAKKEKETIKKPSWSQ